MARQVMHLEPFPKGEPPGALERALRVRFQGEELTDQTRALLQHLAPSLTVQGVVFLEPGFAELTCTDSTGGDAFVRVGFHHVTVPMPITVGDDGRREHNP